MSSSEVCNKRCKRKQASTSQNNEDVLVLDVIDLTMDSPRRVCKRKVPAPLTEQDFVALKIKHTNTPKESRSNTFFCPVCYEDLQDELKPTTTKCGHIFCHSCITNVLKKTKKCPKCQSNITKRSCIRLYFDRN